jgi:FkbM family methyltransferase
MNFKKLIYKSFYKLIYSLDKGNKIPIGNSLPHDLQRLSNSRIDKIFDIGAHHGETAIEFAQFYKNSTIYSFEPVKQSFDLLEKNSKPYSNIKPFHLGIGSESEQREIHINEKYSTINSFLEQTNTSLNNTSEITNVMSLDDFVNENNISEIDILKIDTEGWELNVLEGAKNFLKAKSAQFVVCEVALEDNKNQTPFIDVFNTLTPMGYRFCCIYDVVVKNIKSNRAYGNALFVRK